MQPKQNPKWWQTQYDSGWERVKAAFRRDWDQTKHDLGGRKPDTDQDVDDTIKQAAGKQPIPPRGVPTFEENEAAYKFGYGARQYYGRQYPSWNDDLETQLRKDWATVDGQSNWDNYRAVVKRGWDYENKGS